MYKYEENWFSSVLIPIRHYTMRNFIGASLFSGTAVVLHLKRLNSHYGQVFQSEQVIDPRHIENKHDHFEAI